ncbi:xyloglucan endotransglucosylase/hydrolase protein 9-like [Aristolochia californica]|uniref:xyloglucan endotransglucosylase/hydrolase protein 9-like n=1 Tax=Aristolochia californica TaxID=171875 RepID=UPI0035D53A6E
MGRRQGEMVWVLLLCLVTQGVNVAASKPTNFSELFQFSWAPEHIVTDAGVVKLTLDYSSGCGFESRKKYLFGQVSADIKLVEGDSAGTVTAFYMSSQGPTHDELDFEFLGNVTGEPYLVQTNIYVNGTGNREQRHTLWFDPTMDSHSYSLLWNHHHIIDLIDGVPIRTFANREEKGIPYPNSQAMGIYSSVWNADDWATQGGRVKTNWSHAPFISTFRKVAVDACEFSPETDDLSGKCREGEEFWWDRPALNELNFHQSHQLKWVRRKHLVYDYCKDTARFTQLPPECSV